METVVVKFNKDHQQFTDEEYQELVKASEIIKRGGLVAFPTETVYGLGGNGFDSEAAKKIYAAKGRPSDNPLILHLDNLDMLKDVAKEVPESAKKIIAAFCPGPITIVVPKSEQVPYTVTGGLESVAVRIPDNDITRTLISLSRVPIAGPSANISGRPSPTTAQAVYRDLHDRIDMILDDGACRVGVESTIVDCCSEVPTILRPGAITKEMLEEIFPKVEIDRGIVEEGVAPKAPGMKYKHYAPKANMLLIEATPERTVELFQAEIARAQDKNIGLLVSQETLDNLVLPKTYESFIYGSRNELDKVASNIYEGLRYFDDKTVEFILAEGVKDAGLGVAIMNRLRKAAGFNILV